ncbi:MAG: thiamine pyrophosphate-dependent enzyme [Pirellulaceae bacterium]
MTSHDIHGDRILETLLRVRIGQLLTNEMYKQGAFRVPIHLALGHEAIAAAVDAVMTPADQLVLSHRNIHYNLARASSLRPEIDEYLLKPQGLGEGELGSMNLMNAAQGVVYTSSILGNDLSVAAGLAMAQVMKGSDGVVLVVTGDGAMEEGTFYESLLFESSNQLPVVVIVENNQWSLATRIDERRCPIDVRGLVVSLGGSYERFDSNDAIQYAEMLSLVKATAQERRAPVCVEVMLTTLGSWYQETSAFPAGKFINYHAGPAPTVQAQNGAWLTRTSEDPLFVLEKYFSREEIEGVAQRVFSRCEMELS